MSRGYGGRGLEPLSYGESAMPSKPVSSPESFQAFDLVQSSKVPFVESSFAFVWEWDSGVSAGLFFLGQSPSFAYRLAGEDSPIV